MPPETLYPTLEEILFLHTRLIERFGGSAGLRDPGLIESALARARSGYYGSLSQQAAALLHSLARNHPFADGNKRVAFAACAVFLRMNGYDLLADADAGEALVVRNVIEHHAEVNDIADWLEARMVPVERGDPDR